MGALCRTHRFKAALGSGEALNGPRADGRADALELVGPKIAKIKDIAKETARRISDDHCIRLYQGLHASRDIRSAPNDGMLPKLTLATQVADYHHAGGDADTHGERFSCAGFEPCDGSNDIQCSSHRSFGIVLVRNGIAEIRKDAVSAKV